MNVIVKPKNASGRLLSPQEQEGRPAFAGGLEIVAQHSAALDAVVLIAKLIDGSDHQAKRSALELHDAVLLWFTDSSMGLRGVEIIEGAQYAQSWVVLLEPKALTTGKRPPRKPRRPDRPRITTEYLLSWRPAEENNPGRPNLRLVWSAVTK